TAIGQPDASTQAVKATPSMVLGYSDQGLTELADADTPAGVINRRFDVGDQRARAVLAGAGLGIDLQ
ncbi:hypothetical protein, partial [Serratia marcescens]|uniref:hypothetical protein n=1 Tax=Serratia marcescens TaxID=615 RepID=UPI001954C7B3